MRSGSCSGATTSRTTTVLGFWLTQFGRGGLAEVAAFHRKRRSVILFLAMIGAVPILAQQTRVYQDGNSWVEETTGTLPSARELRINIDVGALEVKGTAHAITFVIRKRSFASTKAEAQQQFQAMKVTAANLGEAASLEGRLLHRNLNRFTAEILLEVPHDLEKVRLDTGSGAMTVSSLAATVIGKTGGGAIKLDDIGGPVVVTTGGGDVVAGSLGSDASIKNGGGSVRVEKIAGPGKISTGGGKVFVGAAKGLVVDNGAGSIEVRKCNGDLKASTGGGNLNLGDVAGSVRIDAGAGSVRLASATGRVQVSTGGGSVELFKLSQGAQVDTGAGAITVEFVGSPGAFTDSSLHTAAGDVVVFLPKNLAVTVHASSDLAPGYGIKSEFPALRIAKQGGDWGPQSMWAEGTLNGGGPLLRVRTTIGHIDFRNLQSH